MMLDVQRRNARVQVAYMAAGDVQLSGGVSSATAYKLHGSCTVYKSALIEDKGRALPHCDYTTQPIQCLFRCFLHMA